MRLVFLRRADLGSSRSVRNVLLGASVGAVLLAACGTDVSYTGPSGTGGEGAVGGDPTTTTSSVGGYAGEGAGMPGGAGGTGGAAGGGAGAAGGSGGSGGEGGTDPWAGPLESLAELDLGALTFGDSHYFPIPDRTLGFTVLAEAQTTSDIVGIFRLKPPVGSSVIYDFAMAGHDLQVFGDAGWVAGADPQSDSSDALPVQEGNWLLVLGGDGGTDDAHARVYARRTSDGQFHGGVMDINVFIAPGTVSTGYMTSMLSDHFYPYAGIDEGTTQVYQLGGESTVISSYQQLRQLFESSQGIGTVPALNLFVVGDFAGQDFGAAIGVAGGIPGSPMRHGTTRSGVAYQPTGNKGYDASVLAHEIGHVGGLFHTTEIHYDETDPLSDTPSCDSQTIQNNPNQCPDVNNLMFPIAYGGSAFSAAQLRVLEGSALYRGIVVAGGAPSGPMALTLPPKTAPFPRLAANAPGPTLAAGPWRSPTSELERLLGAVWCARAGNIAAVVLRAAGPDGPTRLCALVQDPAASDLVRARALAVLAGAGGRQAGPTPVELGASVLRSNQAGRLLRLAALEVLERRDLRRLQALAPRLRAGGDAVLAAHLRRLGL